MLPVILALALATEPLPADRPTRPAVQALAFVGVAFLGVGLGFEITGRAGADPRAPVLEWSAHAQADTVGGIALMGAGLCLVTIAAILTPWHFPSLAVWVTPGGGVAFALGAQLP
jgi:hypothetical protein